MAWTDSRIFRQMLTDTLAGTQVYDLDAPSDVYKVALYNNSITPDKDVAANASAYNTGQWALANEVSQGGQWAAGGVALASMTLTAPATGVIMFDAADTASGAAATLANVYGTLVYNDTDTTPQADPGIVFNYLGGANSVAGGTLTIVWNANGLFRITV